MRRAVVEHERGHRVRTRSQPRARGASSGRRRPGGSRSRRRVPSAAAVPGARRGTTRSGRARARRHPRAPVTTSWSESSCSRRLPQTSSHSAKHALVGDRVVGRSCPLAAGHDAGLDGGRRDASTRSAAIEPIVPRSARWTLASPSRRRSSSLIRVGSPSARKRSAMSSTSSSGSGLDVITLPPRLTDRPRA